VEEIDMPEHYDTDPEQQQARIGVDIDSIDRAIEEQRTRVSHMESGMPDDLRLSLKGVAQAARRAKSLQESIEAGMDLSQLMDDIGATALDNLHQLEQAFRQQQGGAR